MTALAITLGAGIPEAWALPPVDVAGLIDADRDPLVPGCVAGAFRRGALIVQGASGAADIARKEALTTRSRLYAGSVSKQFTALGLAKLVEAGRVSLDDEVQTYIPELPRYGSRLTLRMLLHHVAGVRDSLDLLSLAGVETSRTPMQDALRLVYLQRGLNFTPGVRFSYSNGGYLLLAETIERVSGMPFQDYMRQTVLDPLGMTRSFFLATLPAPGLMAHGYVRAAGGFEIRDTYPDFSGSGGLVTTLEDLGRYDHDVMAGHKVVTPAADRILTEKGRFNDGRPVEVPGTQEVYAGGLMVGLRGGVEVIEHGGAAEGFLAHTLRIPSKGLEVIVLCNRNDVRPAALADRLAEAIDGEIFAPPPRAPAPPPQAPGKPPSGTPPTGTLAPGRYVSDELSARWTLEARGDALVAHIDSDWPTRLRPAPDVIFKPSPAGYAGPGVTLTAAPTGDGFTVDTGRATGIRFRLQP